MSRAVYTVARSIGRQCNTLERRTASGAAGAFLSEAFDLISAFAMRDTAAGWRFWRAANRVSRDIERGLVVQAALTFQGEALTFTAR